MSISHLTPAALVAVVAITVAREPLAQASGSVTPATVAARSVGTIVIAHGGDAGWNALVRDVAKQANTGGPVEIAFLMGPEAKTARFQDAVARLRDRGAREIVIVPVLVSSHSGHYQQIRYLAGDVDSTALSSTMMHHLHMSGIERSTHRIPMRVTAALDDAPELAKVLADRARALAPSVNDRALFLVGHGPESSEDYARWMENCRRIADSVRVLTGFRDVRIGLVRDDAPAAVRAEAVRGVRDIIELQAAATGKEVVVVPLLISKGQVSRDKLPRDLAGLPIIYAAEGVAPHPEIARWIERMVRGAKPPEA